MECRNSFFSISPTSGYKQNCGIIISNSESKRVSLPTSKTAVCLLMLYYILGEEHTHTHTHMLVFMVYGDSPYGFYTVQTVCAIALHLPYT